MTPENIKKRLLYWAARGNKVCGPALLYIKKLESRSRWLPVLGQDTAIPIPYCIVRNSDKDLLGFGSFVSVVDGELRWVTEPDFKDSVAEYYLLPADSYTKQNIPV